MKRRLGAPPSLAPDDILLARAIESGHLTHIRTRGIGNARSAGQAHLVVAPIIASNDHWIGTLVISKMPFAALNKDTLQLIAVLCAAYADVLAAAPDARRLAAELPNCPVEFADELTRLHRLSSRFSIDSQISCLSFGPSPRREELFATVLGMRRSPDCVWTLRQDENHLLITLIPFGEPGTTAGHLNRVRERLRTVTGAEMEELAISHLILSLCNPDAIERFKKIVVEAVPA